MRIQNIEYSADGVRMIGQRAVDALGMKGFFNHEATDRRSWNAMIELFNETLGTTTK
jgi:hypothetical protein